MQKTYLKNIVNLYSPEVSVIIPTFNRAKKIDRCLESLKNQTFKNFEVLVCDDGSTDNTKEVVKKYYSCLNLKYIYIENFGGPAKPRNIGIKNSKSEILSFLDSDDWWTNEKLELSLEFLNKSQADLVYHDAFIKSDKKSKFLFSNKIKSWKLKKPIFDDLWIHGNALITSTVLIKKKLLIKINGFSESKNLIGAEDFDAWLKISRITDKFIKLPGTHAFYNIGIDNLTTIENSIVYMHELKKIYSVIIKNKNLIMTRWEYQIKFKNHLKKRRYMKILTCIIILMIFKVKNKFRF